MHGRVHRALAAVRSISAASFRVVSLRDSPRSISASSSTRASVGRRAARSSSRSACPSWSCGSSTGAPRSSPPAAGASRTAPGATCRGPRASAPSTSPEPPADVRVDLVEHDQRADRVVGREHRLQGQHRPRQFAAAGDLPQRPGRLAGVGREHQFEVVDARGGHVAGQRVVGQRRSTSMTASSFALRHLQVGEVLLGLGRELLRHLRRGLAQRRRGLLQVGERRPAARRRCRRGRPPASEAIVSFASSVVAVGDQFVRRLAVPRLQLLQERDPLLDLFQPLGVGLEPLGTGRGTSRRGPGPRAAALRAAGHFRKLRVERRPARAPP